MTHLKSISFTLILLIISLNIQAQTNLFASLQGSQTVDTTNWHFNGDAFLGDTGGDSDAYPNEVVLTPAQDNKFGQVFYKTPIDLTTCTKWRAEFEIRMFDGSGADGIAFCVIDQLPDSYMVGYAMGVPLNSNGLKVAFDSYDNYMGGVQCGGSNPEIQIGYGVGYSECDNTMTRLVNNTSIYTKNLGYLVDKFYDKITVTYDNGTVTVTTKSGTSNPLHTNQTLTSTVTPISGKVYFGFTSGTGGLNNTHSIRNVNIFADVPATNDAGLDQTICSGQTAQLGTASTPNHTYTWTPSTDLSSASISNPIATKTNTTTNPSTHTYIVKTERQGAASCYMQDTVDVIVNPAPVLNEVVSFCQGTSVTSHGNTINTDGTHTFFIPAPSGCDTTLIVTASYLPTTSSTTNTTICEGKSVTFNGTSYATSGTYTHTIPGSGGCDSVATLVLTVDPVLTGSLSQAICSGGDFTYQGQTYNSAGIYTVNLQNTQGCDSIVTLTITESTNLVDTTYDSFCSGETYSFNGTNYTAEGVFDIPLTTAQGCDSIHTLVLTFSAGIDVFDTVSKCQNETISYQGQSIVNAGDYTFTVTATSGCDTTIHLNVMNTIVPTITIDTVICQGEKITLNNQDYSTAGVYTINTASPSGCDSIITLNLNVLISPTKPEVATNLPIPCFNQEFIGKVENPNTIYSYIWYTDTNAVSIQTGNELTYLIDENTTLIYVAADNGTCLSDYEIIPITVSQLFNDNFEMPNVITPNDDGANDVINFDAIFGGCLDYEVIIFNRWGNIVFSNGTIFNGKDKFGNDLMSGTYFYKLKYEGGERHGFITLVR